jgi:hypothetical protein
MCVQCLQLLHYLSLPELPPACSIARKCYKIGI